MANPQVILETTAEDHSGFPLMLWKAVCVLLGRPARPRYVVFENSLSPAGSEFRADVHIGSCPLGTSQPYVIQGWTMPTLSQAIQVAAWEGLVRLRYMEPAMAKSRAFHLLPARPQSGVEAVQTSIREEVDPAVITLVTYGAAMTKFCHSLRDELFTTRRNLGRARMQLRRAGNLPNLNLGPAQSTGHPFPDDLLEPRLDASGTQALAPVPQYPQAGGIILEGVPAIPHPAGDGDVDTTLRLGHTPPTTRGRQAE
jgi:hypothetical protein